MRENLKSNYFYRCIFKLNVIIPFPNCLGKVVPSAAATALGAALVENLDDVAMLTLIVWVAEGPVCPNFAKLCYMIQLEHHWC